MADVSPRRLALVYEPLQGTVTIVLAIELPYLLPPGQRLGSQERKSLPIFIRRRYLP
jgi:hypothetical protein